MYTVVPRYSGSVLSELMFIRISIVFVIRSPSYPNVCLSGQQGFICSFCRRYSESGLYEHNDLRIGKTCSANQSKLGELNWANRTNRIALYCESIESDKYNEETNKYSSDSHESDKYIFVLGLDSQTIFGKFSTVQSWRTQICLPFSPRIPR